MHTSSACSSASWVLCMHSSCHMSASCQPCSACCPRLARSPRLLSRRSRSRLQHTLINDQKLCSQHDRRSGLSWLASQHALHRAGEHRRQCRRWRLWCSRLCACCSQRAHATPLPAQCSRTRLQRRPAPAPAPQLRPHLPQEQRTPSLRQKSLASQVARLLLSLSLNLLCTAHPVSVHST